ncbi:MAG: response regulator [Acidobacteriota bacterium]
MSLRVLIADDESHCRAELKHLLSDDNRLIVVGEAANGIEALEQCRVLTPNILFLDIQMPGLNGMEVAAALDTQPLPQIIFVTAYDQHAIKAFELGAIDYLLKPVNAERLQHSITRVLKQQTLSNNPLPDQLDTLMAAWQQIKPEYLARIIGRKAQKIFVLPIAEIYCFEIESQLLFALTERERYWTNYQMKTIEPRLDPKQFVRVHRENIVNINFIRELAPITRERYEITLHNNHKLTVSRNYLPQLKELLGWA